MLKGQQHYKYYPRSAHFSFSQTAKRKVKKKKFETTRLVAAMQVQLVTGICKLIAEVRDNRTLAKELRIRSRFFSNSSLKRVGVGRGERKVERHARPDKKEES